MRIFLNMPVGNFYGWAVCGKNLLRELSKLCEVVYIEEGFENQLRTPEDQDLVNRHKAVVNSFVDGVVIHTLKPDFSPTCHTWGAKNIGYLFYEGETLTDEQINNLKRYDVVLSGSKWSEKVIRRHGIECGYLIQGVNTKIFYPRKHSERTDFVVFSGGKWEHRKGQDLVIRVVKRLSEELPNVVLYHNWSNIFDYERADEEIKSSLEGVKHLWIHLEDQKELSRIMADTDIGIFLNRCEGGTNLVLMEYLACGNTAVVRADTGQKDVVSDKTAFLVNGSDDEVVDSAVGHIEYAYSNIKELREMGLEAARSMQDFSWANMANNLLVILGNR